MPLLDHLGELRRRLTIVLVALVVTALVVYVATPTLIELMVAQIEDAMQGGDLYVFTALGGFSIRFKVACFFAVIIDLPIILWQIMAFTLPALHPNERKWVVPTVAAMVVLFFLGMIFCYLIIQPTAFGWLLNQTYEFANALADAEDYLNIYMLLEIGFGLAFEVPLVIFYLTVLHIIPYATMRAQWRIVYVVLMVISAIVTPDASPVTMLLMFMAFIVLFEASLLVSRYVIISRDGKEGLKWTREEYNEHKYNQELERELAKNK